MNDFTKKELEDIHYCIFRYHKNAGLSQPESLLDKAQAMIDNYCDHEWVFFISPHGNRVRCTQCERGIPA